MEGDGSFFVHRLLGANDASSMAAVTDKVRSGTVNGGSGDGGEGGARDSTTEVE